MEKPGTPQNEEAHLEVLSITNLLPKGKQSTSIDLTDNVKTLFDVPIVKISLLVRKRQHFKSAQEGELSETPSNSLFCGHKVFQSGQRTLQTQINICDLLITHWSNFHRIYDSICVIANRRFLTSFLSHGSMI